MLITFGYTPCDRALLLVIRFANENVKAHFVMKKNQDNLQKLLKADSTFVDWIGVRLGYEKFKFNKGII